MKLSKSGIKIVDKDLQKYIIDTMRYSETINSI